MEKILEGKISPPKHKKPSTILGLLIASIFLIESIIMTFSYHHPKYSIEKYDSIILSLLTIPIFYYIVYKPLREYAHEKTQWEKKMADMEKLNILGQMASVIAHEVRNPMTSVKGYLQLLSTRDYYQRDKETFQLMIDEIDRGNEIITEFLLLNKNNLYKRQTINLNDIIKAISPLLSATATCFEQSVEINLGKIPDLILDSSEIKQLITNLYKNATEAISPGGKISLSTYEDGNEVFFEIKDTGTGIPEDVLLKIGTPFFTTKTTGTGLGLVVCYSIISRYQGHMDVETTRNGTTIRVAFPKNNIHS